MASEVIERKLYEAASKGDVTTLVQLLEEDPYLVHGVSFPCSRNLLHIAAVHGQTTIVEQVLNFNPQLALILDSQQLSPLHIATSAGHVEICQKLLLVAPEACWWRDCHGMNPLHIAVMKGRVEICQKLLSVAPEVCWWRDSQDMNPVHIAAMKGNVEMVEHLLQENPSPAMERLRRGETVLHLCVKHGQLRALKILVEKLGELVHAIDEGGETIMHLAVRLDQLETIQYLVESNKVRRETYNSMGKSQLEILNNTRSNYWEIRRILINLLSPNGKWLSKLSDTTMLVAVLIATMAFQFAVNPPGGVWQEDKSPQKAGDAVIAYTHPSIYKDLVANNTIAFVSSLLTILIVTTGGSFTSIHVFWISQSLVAVSLISISAAYGGSTMVTNPSTKTKSVQSIVATVMHASLSFNLVIFLNILLIMCVIKWKSNRALKKLYDRYSNRSNAPGL